MKLKRLAAAILAAAMIAAVFAGCSSKKPEATETFGAIVGTEDEKYSKYFLGIGHPNWNRYKLGQRQKIYGYQKNESIITTEHNFF